MAEAELRAAIKQLRENLPRQIAVRSPGEKSTTPRRITVSGSAMVHAKIRSPVRLVNPVCTKGPSPQKGKQDDNWNRDAE
jgi:hypothetical protein